MSDVERRDVLIGTLGLATAALAATEPAAAGDASFMNNVPDPLLSGDDLPTFKFALEKSEGKVIGNSYGKEATVKQLPISKGIAGVSMRLEPGTYLQGSRTKTCSSPARMARTNNRHGGMVREAAPRPRLSASC